MRGGLCAPGAGQPPQRADGCGGGGHDSDDLADGESLRGGVDGSDDPARHRTCERNSAICAGRWVVFG